MDLNVSSLLNVYRQKKARLAILEAEMQEPGITPAKWEDVEQEIGDLKKHIWLCDTMVSGLDAKERFMVEQTFFEERKMTNLIVDFSLAFGTKEDSYGYDYLRRIKEDAVGKMRWILAGCNDVAE
jgi:hypothetical protein